MAEVAVLNAGGWGTALAVVLARAGHAVRLWARRPEQAVALASSRVNEAYLPGVGLPDGVRPTNDLGEAVGMSETSAPDPNGEDICGFGTHLICLPFLWHNGVMHALPTVGGNNGQASAVNNSGEVVGYAENGIVDSTCPPGTVNNRVDLPVLWEKGKAQALPLIGMDTDGVTFGISNQGQAVGYSGTCTTANSAVLWENGIANATSPAATDSTDAPIVVIAG